MEEKNITLSSNVEDIIDQYEAAIQAFHQMLMDDIKNKYILPLIKRIQALEKLEANYSNLLNEITKLESKIAPYNQEIQDIEVLKKDVAIFRDFILYIKKGVGMDKSAND